MGMGLMRKALFVATGGLSGLVFKDKSKKERTVKAAGKQVRPRKRTKATRPKPRAARTSMVARPKPRAARTSMVARPKPRAARTSMVARPKPRAARTSTVARTVGSGNGTTNELERLVRLHGRGALTDGEFAAAKAKILGTSLTPHRSETGPETFPAVEANVAAARHLADLPVHDRVGSVAPSAAIDGI